jgi:hypothetical protein
MTPPPSPALCGTCGRTREDGLHDEQSPRTPGYHAFVPSPPLNTRAMDDLSKKLRDALDDLDDALHECDALMDADVFAARRSLGIAIGRFVVSAEEGHPVRVTARTFPPYDDNGAMHVPGPQRQHGGAM